MEATFIYEPYDDIRLFSGDVEEEYTTFVSTVHQLSPTCKPQQWERL